MGVNIYESPVKPVVDLEDGVTVYVPGYANYGPEEPTLCSTVSEFESLYGTSPYLFEGDQNPTGGAKIAEGSPEKGYLYAKSLLDSGLQVLFHRFKSVNIGTASADFSLSYKTSKTYPIRIKASNFGKAYSGIEVKLVKKEGSLFEVEVKNPQLEITYSGIVSLDPTSPVYFKNTNFGLIKFISIVTSGSGAQATTTETEISDTTMAEIIKDTWSFSGLTDNKVTLSLTTTASADFSLNNFYSGLADSFLNPLTDFEKYPSVTYLTTGGYYINSNIAGKLMNMAERIKAIALVDLYSGAEVKDATSWTTYKNSLSELTGTAIAKGKSAAFIGCNSFDLSPYRTILGDSFNYLKCLGENMKRGVKSWIPVANDPNGVSPLGYDTTNKISTELAETMAEGKIGVSANPLIYSTSAGGYKIMGNRTLLSNDGVLSPNSFLNVSVVVNRVERACRQTGNKLKIVSTSPNDTFIKFKTSVAKTLDPMVVSQDGLKSYKIKLLPKTKPATIDIEISLVVVEGIETFNIYIPYSIAID